MTLASHLAGLLLLLLLVGAPLPLGAYLAMLGEARAACSRSTQAWLVLLTSWCAVHVAIGLLLGILHRFALGPLVLAESAVALGGAALLQTARRRVPGPPGAAAAGPDRAPHWPERAVLAVLVATGSVLFLGLATQPITEYDSLAYHLPVMAKWYQTGSLTMLEQFFNKSRYPYNWEVLSALFFMPFADDFLVAFPKLVAWALFGLSVYRLSIQVGARRAHALASALLVLTMPLVLWHVNTMLVDVPLAALFTACLSLSVSYARTRAPSELALFVAALGVLAGIKPSALPYVAVLLGSLAVLVRTSVFLREPTAPASPRAPAVVLGAGAAAGFLLAGCFWYVRNVVEIGNPIGFVRVRVFGVTLLSSAVDLIDWADMRRTSLAHLFEVRNLEHWKVLLDQLALQLGPSFFVLVVASLPLLAAAGAPERGIRRERRLWLAALLVATGLLYWSTPYNTDVGDYRFRVTGMAVGGGFRFGLPFVGVLAVAAAAGATVLRARDASLVALALLGAAAGLLGAGMLGLGVGLVACAVLGLTWTRLPTRIGGLAWDLSPARRAVAVLLALAVLTAGTLLLRQERTAQRRVAYGGLLEYMAANLGRAEVVGYLLSDRSYLFYGENWRQKVVYVPATSPSLTGWLEALAAKGVGVVAIGPVQDEWRSFGEPAWLEQADGPFVSVFGRDPRREPVLYRIKPGRRPAPPG